MNVSDHIGQDSEARNSVQVFGIKGFGGRSALERGSRRFAPRRPACWRMLSVAARTVTLALWAWTRALDVGTRWVSERELMARAPLPRMLMGARGVRAAIYLMLSRAT